MTMKERIARAIAKGCNLDPDAISPRAAERGNTIPEWMFFGPATQLVLQELLTPTEGMVRRTVVGVDNPTPEQWAIGERVCNSLSGPNMQGETACAEVVRDYQAAIEGE